MWLELTYTFGIVIAAALVAGRLLGALVWRRRGRRLRTRLESMRHVRPAIPIDLSRIEELPSPVQRYLRRVLEDGHARVDAVTVTHKGSFNIDPDGERWRPFRSTQRITTYPPGFVWDARIQLVPGVPIRVHDGYLNGSGVLGGRLGGLVKLFEEPSTPELAKGELLRYLAESVWYPTALLPGMGVTWRAIDERSAEALLEDSGNTVALTFDFDGDGLVRSVATGARGRRLNGDVVITPWRGRWWDWERVHGILVPLSGEVAWLGSGGPLPYWRGRIISLAYQPAR